ncbi:PREDICTED: trichohyalin-like protein 1 [Condylura cristata]|uniref:trichohyalin-like protein 1 n=1 Tax=Condylura cristata TaxID=143302 RepID=UPI00033443E2|nr:PREDICTED: trichohyalin-like protein 1 [Condylura cristata]
MPQLLRDVLCVIDTFHKYAREDSNEATLTYRELKQLIQGEFGDILQSSIIRAVERNLNLLNIDSDGTISFDEFVLTIFNLLNRCYLNIQSLLNSEPRQVSKSGKPNNVDLQASSRAGQPAESTPTTQDQTVFSSKTASSTELSPEERGAGRHNSLDPHGDTKTCKQLRGTSGYKDPKNQHLERDGQSQEDALSTGDNRVQLETNKPMAVSGQTGSSTKQERQNKEIPREGDEPTREQSGAETKEKFGKQSSQAEETVQGPRKDQAATAGKDTEGHSEAQGVQGKDEHSSELADLPEQTATQNPLQTQKSTVPDDESGTAEMHEAKKDADKSPPETKDPTEPEHDGKASESQEPPAQEKKQDLLVHHDSRNISEMPHVSTEGKEGKDIEGHETRGQKESERKTQLPALEDQTQDEKCQELRESSKGRDAKKISKIQELSSPGSDENHPEIEGEKEEHAKESATEAPVSSESAPAEETPGAGERGQELALPENQATGENKDTNAQDKLMEDHDDQGHSPKPTVTQNEGSSKNSNSLTPKEGNRSSETSDSPGEGNSQSQADLLRETVQGSQNNNPDTQNQVVAGEKNRTQEAVVPAVRGENAQHVEGEKQPAEGDHQGQGSRTQGPDPTEEPSEHPETQTSTAGDENREPLKTELPGLQAADPTEQLSITLLLAKGDSRKEKETGASETQEAQVQSLGEDNSAPPETYGEAKETATSAEEDERPLELAGEGEDQSNPAKKGYDSSVSQPGLKERSQKAQELRPVERSAIYPNPLYTYLQEKILQQTDTTQEEQQKQAQTVRASSPELGNEPPVASLTHDSQGLQQCTRELLPDEDPVGPQQISVLQALGDEKDGGQREEEPAPHRETSTTKQ